jgi:hypothetical protein
MLLALVTSLRSKKQADQATFSSFPCSRSLRPFPCSHHTSHLRVKRAAAFRLLYTSKWLMHN